ncbi:transglycosylase domain-containing protein [Massilia sp. SYSU DXS3249]
MESTRRFKRPRNVFRAVRNLRARPEGNAAPVLDAAAQEDPQYDTVPHLSLVSGATAAAVDQPVPDGAGEPPQEPEREGEPPRGKGRGKRILFGLLLVVVAAGSAYAVYETRTSTLQAKVFARMMEDVHFRMAKGPSDAIRFPAMSPYDARLGYAHLPTYLAKLQTRDYVVDAQARMSPKMLELADHGLFATYHEKTRTGLEILDWHGQPLFGSRFPERSYERFDDAPQLLVQSLLFIENRELLDPAYPKRNPAVEWDRFSKAVFDKVLSSVGIGGGGRVAGGSTLATQIEKYRHSPEGRTASLGDKLVQMASATLRAYRDGEDTTGTRRQIVLDYLNTVPLSAKPGYGEVNGIGDGMWVWYGRDFAKVSSMLKGRLDTPEAVLVYKEALSLMIAQRRPAYYLGAGKDDLETLTDSHLRVLAQSGVITPQLRDAALRAKLHPALHSGVEPPAANAFVSRKAANAVRNHLGYMLGEPRLYNLDRLDMSVVSTLDGQAQQAVTNVLRQLTSAEAAQAAGLTGKGLLGNGDPAQVVYSFTLMERGENVNYLRVQTDNYDQPLDINEQAKLDLGSTAKLRTLVTYLDIVDQLYRRYEALDPKALREARIDPKDRMSQWAVEYFLALPANADRGLKAMLDAAMLRKYSANPGEGFFTGGGLHYFGNFSKLDNSKIMTVQEALQQSTNLVFVRMMRDVARYYMFQLPGSSAALLADADDPRRAQYLARFADAEGKTFLAKFWNKYKGKNPNEVQALLLAGVRPAASKLAAVHRTIAPTATLQQFSAFIDNAVPNEVDPERIEKMYDQYAPANMSLADRGYVASVHPLELWLVGYLRNHPKAGWSEVVGASVKERQEVYSWLFKTNRKNAQDKRIAGLLEVESFLKIHAQWKKMGYPFDSLVPSYATTLGASADRPAALAELMGIIVNGGVRKPVERIDSLHFAKDTPYETLVKRSGKVEHEVVLSPEVARTVADAIRGVVSDGTAKRVKTAFALQDGNVIALGGKTGTGDQRFDVYARGGRLIESRYVNRSATFVFNIGERFFGTMTAYVHGPQSENYDFTSALPVQLLTTLAPSLMPMIEASRGGVSAQLLQPQPQKAAPQLAQSQPVQSQPAQLQPEAAEPQPAQPKPEPKLQPAESKPKAAESKPASAEPKPKTAEAKPASAEPKPKAAEPKPKAESKPAQPKPQPKPPQEEQPERPQTLF